MNDNMRLRRPALLLLVLCVLAAFCAGGAWAGDDLADAAPDSTGNTIVPFPFYFYTPETESGGGVAVAYFRRAPGAAPDARPAQYQAIGIFTARKQYTGAFALETYPGNGKYRLAGEFSFSKFPTTIYGVGNDTDSEVSEDYTPHSFAIRAGFYREIREGLRTGPRFAIRDEDIVETEPGGWMDSGAFTGSDGGRVVRLGWALFRDGRDNTLYPTVGHLDEFSFQLADGLLGSDFDYSWATIDMRRYRAPDDRSVLAGQLWLQHMEGAPPIQDLQFLGGQNLLRGFYDGRFRDRNAWALQLEYRRETWWRTGFVVFASAGDVAHRPGDLSWDGIKASYGGGVRFLVSRKERMFLRIDYGVTDEGNSGVYMGMGEAF